MKTSGEQEKKLKVINGKLYFDGECVGETKDIAGFTQYYFEEEPLGYGANGVTFCVTHKILNVKQVIKIYFPKENEKYVSHKAQEEARKNANTTLAGVIAVVYDAGEYTYPCKLWYSIMESVSSYCTIKQWRAKRNNYFQSNSKKFDVNNSKCLSSIHTSLNLSAGILKAIITLYENNIIHGDLNPGNILWIFNRDSIDEELRRLSSYHYSVLGELEPFYIKLIDMGSSKVNPVKNDGKIRDFCKLYEHIKSLLFPLFVQSKIKFEDWFNFELIEVDESNEFGVEKKVSIKQNDKLYMMNPHELAGDFFRLICVLTIAFGIITNVKKEEENSIGLEDIDRKDFYVLMYQKNIDDAINAFSFESMIVLKIIRKLGSRGRCINWENVWNTYPFNRINISQVFHAKRCDDYYIFN